MKVIGTSEWDVRAMISYSQIHNMSKFNKELEKVEKWSIKKVKEYFKDKVFSLNSKVPSFIQRKPRTFQNNVIAANITNNNFPDINTLSAEDITGTDLLTYSFPCQGLSIANMGRAKGIKQDSNSTSNLIWQIKRLLDDVVKKKRELPKYLLMENVKALIGKNHKDDYEAWKEYLDSIGYKTFTFVQYGNKHNNLQKRGRVFGLSIKKEFSEQLKLSEDEISKLLVEKYGHKLSLEKRKKRYEKILTSSSRELIEMSIPNDTKSRVKMKNENLDLIKDAEKRGYTFNTLTTKQDRHPNLGMIEHGLGIKGKLSKRFITPKEGYMIMG
ncbi:MAG: DNA cytosine methyltransferase, partial [Mycoplasmataceae bacterium]|nr:DNA cytosine methyltransferase [Mycoplasmataceae bacterium]